MTSIVFLTHAGGPGWNNWFAPASRGPGTTDDSLAAAPNRLFPPGPPAIMAEWGELILIVFLLSID